MYYGYARVSTVEQNDTSIEVQLEFLKHQAEEIGESFTPKYEKASGKDVEGRDVLKSLLLSLKYGDILGVYDNSRLGRNTEENLKVIHDLNRRGVKVQISGRFVDPTNPQDELMFTIESSISTYQRKVQLDKSKAGIKKKKENGDWFFKGNMYGWDAVKKNGKLIITINEREAKVIRYVFAEYLKGLSSLQISKELIEQEIRFDSEYITPCQVRRMLLKPLYMGYYFIESGDWKKIHLMDRKTIESRLVKSNLYPPIISEEVWWSVINSWKNVTRTHSSQFKYRYCGYELSSILRCGYCGHGYTHSYRKSRNLVTDVYTCNVHGKNCPTEFRREFKAIILEPLMRITFLITFLSGDEVNEFFTAKKDELFADTEALRSEITMVDKEISDIKVRQNRVLDAIEEGIIDLSVAKERLNTTSNSIEELQKRKESIEKQIMIQSNEIDDILQQESLDLVDEFLHSESRSSYYKKYLESALMFKDRMEVTYVNGKKFIITHPPLGTRKIKPQFFRAFYKDEFQYSGQIDIENATVKINRLPINDDLFLKYVADSEDKLMEIVHNKLSELN